MREGTGGHVEGRLQPFLDGELPASEAAAVEAHASTCPACGAALAELRSVHALLARDGGVEPIRPVWPAVRDALRRRSPGRPSLAYLFAASALAAAGLFIGLHLGEGTATRSATVGTESAWSSLSSTLGSGNPGNLAGIYLTGVERSGGTGR